MSATPKTVTIRWGVSGVCNNEMQMGVLIAAMTRLGCSDIAWQELPGKDPDRVAAGKRAVRRAKRNGKQVGRPRGRKTAQPKHKPLSRGHLLATVMNDYLDGGAQLFTTKAWMAHAKRKGFSASAAFAELTQRVKAGTVQRTGRGEYAVAARKAA